MWFVKMQILHTSNFQLQIFIKSVGNDIYVDLKLAGFIYGVNIPLSSLKFSNLYTAPTRFYGSLDEENLLCELCTFSHKLIYMLPNT